MVILSIVIPVYNLEEYVKYTIESVIHQWQEGIELIIINDGSTDSSLTIINECFFRFQHIPFKIINQENRGVAASRNRGVHFSNGKYIMFLDGDDVLSHNAIYSVFGLLESSTKDLIFGGFNKVAEDGKILYEFEDRYRYPKSVTTTDILLREFLLKKFMICIGSFLCRRDFLTNENISFLENLRYGEDVSFFIKCLAKANCISVIPEVFVNYVSRSTSAIGTYLDKSLEVADLYSKNLEVLMQEIQVNDGVCSNTARLIKTCVIPGLILATVISLYKAGHPLKDEIPISFKYRLRRVYFIDTVIGKGRNGIGLYLGAILYSFSPIVFDFMIKLISTRKRF